LTLPHLPPKLTEKLDIRPLLEPRLEWIRGTRYRALAYVGAICLAAAAAIAFTSAPWLPIVGAAFVTAAVSVSKLTTRLLKPTCMDCGRDLSGEPFSTHGIACPDCGSVQMPSLIDLARMDRLSTPDDDLADEPRA
jgi:hypothetical protein